MSARLAFRRCCCCCSGHSLREFATTRTLWSASLAGRAQAERGQYRSPPFPSRPKKTKGALGRRGVGRGGAATPRLSTFDVGELAPAACGPLDLWRHPELCFLGCLASLKASLQSFTGLFWKVERTRSAVALGGLACLDRVQPLLYGHKIGLRVTHAGWAFWTFWKEWVRGGFRRTFWL